MKPEGPSGLYSALLCSRRGRLPWRHRASSRHRAADVPLWPRLPGSATRRGPVIPAVAQRRPSADSAPGARSSAGSRPLEAGNGDRRQSSAAGEDGPDRNPLSERSRGPALLHQLPRPEQRRFRQVVPLRGTSRWPVPAGASPAGGAATRLHHRLQERGGQRGRPADPQRTLLQGTGWRPPGPHRHRHAASAARHGGTGALELEIRVCRSYAGQSGRYDPRRRLPCSLHYMGSRGQRSYSGDKIGVTIPSLMFDTI